jgi:hypothetical protein
VYTGLLTLLGALGVTGAAVVTAVKAAAVRVGERLLDAELAMAVALAINLVPSVLSESSAVSALHDGSLRKAPGVPCDQPKGSSSGNSSTVSSSSGWSRFG